MVRVRVVQAAGIGLGLLVLIGSLPGCAAGRGFKLSAVEARPKRTEKAVAERKPQNSAADLAEAETDEDTPEPEPELTLVSAESDDECEPSPPKKTVRPRERKPAVDVTEPDARGPKKPPQYRRYEVRRPEETRSETTDRSKPSDELDVLLTAYEDDDIVPPAAKKPAGEDDHELGAAVRFRVPPELPGSDAPALRVPPFDPTQSLEERKKLIEKLYTALPAMLIYDDELAQPAWSLPELESIAWENHPALMQAAAQVEVTRGVMIQAGLHPNPTMGWEQDTIGPGIQGYKGPYMSQQIVTGGKLKLQRSAAAMDHENAKVAYQRIKIDIATRVRDAYYDLLVSLQRRKMLAALTRFTDDIYRAQIDLVAGGQAAPYEPLQLRVFAVQARNAVIDADNNVVAAGRRLGAATGMLDLERFHVAGRADDTPVQIDYHSAKAYVLENHTDVVSFRNKIVQSQYQSRLEFIRPRIPDINFYGTYQHAYGVPPFINSYNFQVGAPIPIFDQNQGAILATESSIIANERAHAAIRNDLTGQLAAIVARYDTSRVQAENYRLNILPDQVRTYRGVYSRYREAGAAANENINFGDVIIAQQTLGTAINGYADVLNLMWQAYVDMANVLQMEDLRTLDAWFGIGH